MLEYEKEIKDQQQRSLEKLVDQMNNFMSVVPGPLLGIYNHDHIVLEPSEVLEQISIYLEKISNSEKSYVKDSIAIGWFVKISILILHLSSKQKTLRRKMQQIFTKIMGYRKIKSLINQKSKDMILIRAFFNLSFLQILIDSKQYSKIEGELRKIIKQYETYQDPLLLIPLSQLASVRCLVEQIIHHRFVERHIYKAVELRRKVISSFKQYFDRAILAFYVSDTISIGMKLFQCKSDICTATYKADYLKKLYDQIYTKQFFGQSTMNNLKKKFLKIISAEISKISHEFDETIVKEEEKLRSRPKRQLVKNKSSNSFIYQTPLSTTFHKQQYRSLHRFNCNQKSVLKYLLCFQEKKKVQKINKFSYSCIKQSDAKPVEKELTQMSLENELYCITKAETYVKKPLVSFASFKVRKNNSLRSRRLKRISMVLQQQHASEHPFQSPLKFSKHLNNQISSVEIVFNIEKDKGCIQLMIRQPHHYYQLKIFNVKDVADLDCALLINKYKQQLESSMYYYQFFDEVRQQIESSDIVDMMLSELILEYDGRIEKKILIDYMLLKEYITKYFYWKHLRLVNNISGMAYKQVSVPEVQDFLKFSLFLQNIIESERIPMTSSTMLRSKMKKAMFPILQYLVDSKSIILKSMRKTGPGYYLDMITSNPSNINQIQLVQGTIQITKAEYSLKTYSFKTLSEQQYSKPFKAESINGRQLLTDLIFAGYGTKCTILSLLNQMKSSHDNRMFVSKIKIENQYRKSLIEDQTITLLDDDYKFDSKYSTPLLIGQINSMMSNRKKDYMNIMGLVNIILKQSLKQAKVFQCKVLFQTMKYYSQKQFLHIAVKLQISNTESIIIFEVKRFQDAKKIIFRIQQHNLRSLFPECNYNEMIDRLSIINQNQHKELLLAHGDTFIQSLHNRRNKIALLYRRRICSKIIKTRGVYYSISIYYNFIIKLWEIQIYNQSTIVLQRGFINTFELGLICLNTDFTNTPFSKQDWYIYLVGEDSLPKHNAQETRMWLSLLQNAKLKLQQKWLQISSVILYLERHLGFLNIGKKWIEVCLTPHKQLHDASFSVYGYQQSRYFFYSSISFFTTKQSYMLDYFFQNRKDRQILNIFAEYICEKIDMQEYTEPLFIHNSRSYICNSIQVMDIVMNKQPKVIMKNNSYLKSEAVLQFFSNKVIIPDIQYKPLLISQDILQSGHTFFWLNSGKHTSGVVLTTEEGAEMMKNQLLNGNLENLMNLC